MGTLGQSFGIAGELFGVAQQTRVDEIEDRPQVAQVILDRRAGQRDPCPCLQRFRRFGLTGVRILDRLRLVQNDEPPIPNEPNAFAFVSSLGHWVMELSFVIRI